MISLNNDNIFINLIDMDVNVKGFVKYIGKDDIYIININSRLDTATQIKALNHELKHITNRDFNKNNIEEIETNINKYKQI